MTATREARRRRRDRELAAKAERGPMLTQRDADRAIREQMRRDFIEAERRLGSMAMLSPMWWRE